MLVGDFKAGAREVAEWNRASVTYGGALWALIALGWAFHLVELDALDVLLLLALFVITPLALSLVIFPVHTRPLRNLERLVVMAQPLTALAGGISLFLPVGLLAGAAASLWLIFTGLVGLTGAARLVHARGSRHPLANACLSAALLYLPVGGVWLALARLGVRPLGFSSTLVVLTAVHFHFVNLAALILTGLTGRPIETRRSGWPRLAFRGAAVGMLVDPLLLAAGHTLTQVSGVRFLEAAAATLLALSLLVIATLSLRFIVPAAQAPLARGLLAVSDASVFLTMTLACAYALGNATGLWSISIAQMIAAHGWVNAVGFGCCGLLGWRLQLDRNAHE